MTDDTTWTEIDRQYEFQSSLWLADDESEAVVVERLEEPWYDEPKYAAYVLHPMFEANPEPQEVLVEEVDERAAHESAMDYMGA